MSHTPGPWIAYRRLVVESNKDAVAIVNMARPVVQAHADANLIAAAPDLLAALREIVAMTDEDTGTFRKRGGTYRGLVGIVAANAIAKAEGRA